MKIEIPGNPVPKARHRTFVRGNKIGHYDPQKYFVNKIKKYLLACLRGFSFQWEKTDALHVTIRFYLKTPMTTLKKRKKNADPDIFPHYKLPDLDNLIKMYLDCANRILFPDDRQIASLSCQKFYSSVPRTEFEISIFQPIEEVVCHHGSQNESVPCQI